jgi:acetolactate synthase regulatory subunit
MQALISGFLRILWKCGFIRVHLRLRGFDDHTVSKKRRAILAFMLDRPGVLNKIAMLIRRKMYNVETLTVCKTNQPGTSRMTITLREDSDEKMHQVIKQIEKCTEVISASELDMNESFWREVAIVKLEADEGRIEALKSAYPFENPRPPKPRIVYRSGRRDLPIDR